MPADPETSRAFAIPRAQVPTDTRDRVVNLIQKLSKAVEPPAQSQQTDELCARDIGIHEPPFDMSAAKLLSMANPHHSTCIRVKRDATVGMGFADDEWRAQLDALRSMPAPATPGGAGGGQNAEPAQAPLMRPNKVETKVDKALDPLCDDSFQDVLNDVAEDFWAIAQGYIEVVRETPGDVRSPITGLYHIPAEAVRIEKHGGHRYHYVVNQTGEERHWPRFGRIEQFRGFIGEGLSGGRIGGDLSRISEVIPFKASSALDPYYGVPEWLAPTAEIELSSALRQFKLDFYYNRGVPEYVMVVRGTIPQAKWDTLVQQLTGQTGIGNSHKSVLLNLPAGPDTAIEIVRLAMDSFNGEEEFKDTKDAIDLGIVTAHRVPPLLGGIQIPGKLGAVNEFPQQLAAFQTLLIDHAQRRFQRILGQTLGNSLYNGGLGLVQEDFELRRITDIIDPAVNDTMARMRQSPQQAQAEGRDMKAGVKN